MWIVLTLGACCLFGYELSVRAWRREDLHPLERALAAATIGFGMWIASTWTLALCHALTHSAVMARTAAILIAWAILFLRRGNLRERLSIPVIEVSGRRALVIALVLLPLVLWVEFALWKAAIVPPLTHDALAYHLPKAIFYARAAGFDALNELPPEVRELPAGYEMLLADIIVGSGTDSYTEWLSTAQYLLFVLAGTALATRWWGHSPAMIGVIALLNGGVPVVLLQSVGHKNDLMTGAFMTCGLVWAGRWIGKGETASLMLVVVSFAAAIGAKPQAGLLAICLTPFILYYGIKHKQVKPILGAGVFALAAFLLMGGIVYVLNWTHNVAPVQVGAASNAGGRGMVRYGDWDNLWNGPYVLLAAPFSIDIDEVRVPWERGSWFWKRYELFYSEIGVMAAICALLVPMAWFAYRNVEPQRRTERAVIAFATLAAFILMLPVHFSPRGMYPTALARYVLFIIPVIFAATAAPFVKVVEQRSRRSAAVVLLVPAAFFVLYGVTNALFDRFSPFDYVIFAAKNPGTRFIPFDPNRAGWVVDRKAGPRDRVAMDAGFASWIYPVFGADLKRSVTFIPPGKGPPVIPDVDWIVVDRSWNIIWADRNFKDLADWKTKLGHGTPTEQDLRVFQQVAQDPRYEIEYLNAGQLQAVFKRVR